MNESKNIKPLDPLRKAQEEEYFRRQETEALQKLKLKKTQVDSEKKAPTKDRSSGNKT